MNQAAFINTDVPSNSEGPRAWSKPRFGETVSSRVFQLPEAAKILGVQFGKLVKWLRDAVWLRLVGNAIEPVKARVAQGWLIVTDAGIALTSSGMARLARLIQPTTGKAEIRTDGRLHLGIGFYVARRMDWAASAQFIVVRVMPTELVSGATVLMVHEPGSPDPSLLTEWQFRNRISGLEDATAEHIGLAQVRASAIGRSDFLDDDYLFLSR